MRLKAIADHNRVVRLEDWNGLDLTGGNANSYILNAAMTQAQADGIPVLVPSAPSSTQGVRIDTSVEYKAPLIGLSNGYQASARSQFLPGMSDGSPLFYCENIEGFHVENIAIRGAVGAGPTYSKTNCVGFAFGDTDWVPADGAVETIDASRGYMRNVNVFGCETGFEMLGWIPRFDNLFAQFCGLGFKGRFLNAGNIDLVIEGCGIGFELTDCAVLTAQRILDEGNGPYRTGASRIDRSYDVVIQTYYTEGSLAPYPWLIIGGREPASYPATVLPIVMKGTIPHISYRATLTGMVSGDTWYDRQTRDLHQWNGSAWVNLGKGGCDNIRILGGVVGDVTGSAPIVVDYCNRYQIDVISSSAETYTPPYQATANARADISSAQRLSYGAPNTIIAAGLKKISQYLNPNPLMSGMRFGSDLGVSTRCTIAAETAIVRSGSSALRVTATSDVGAYNGHRITFRDPWVARIAAKGTGITVGAWVWVPDKDGMGSPDTATRYYPTISVLTADGGGVTDTQCSSQHRIRGAYNFMYAYQVPQADAVELRVVFYPNQGPNAAPGDGSVFIVVDELLIAEGDCWEQLANGQYERSPECSGTLDGGSIKLRVTQARAAAMIADTTQTYEVGDTFEYTDPTAGGNAGTKLTSAGWREFGVISLT